MATYATVADFEGYVPGWTTDDPAALEFLLLRAERDIDRVLGPFPRNTDTGLKLDPDDLYVFQADALSRAVCAQAEHAFRNPDFAAGDRRQPASVTGPDFAVSYGGSGGSEAPTIASRAAAELEPLLASLRRRSVRARP